MITINPYLNFAGNCLEAFEFYKSVFGGDFTYIGRYKDMPMEPGQTMSDDIKDLIMHISLPISKETILMGSDINEVFGQRIAFDGNVEVMINAESKDEVHAIWEKLSQDANISMPLADAFWGDYFGGLTDKFGVRWMIICPSDK